MRWFEYLKLSADAHPILSHVIIVLLIAILVNVAVVIARNIFFYRSTQEQKGWRLTFIKAVHKPLIVFIWYLAGVFILFDILDYLNQVHFTDAMYKTISLGTTFICVWFLLRFIKDVETGLLQGQLSKRKFDRTTVDGVSKIAHIVLFVVMALIILQSFGVPLAAIYTVAGGAGLGLTIAAQDVLRNFFGGIVLYFDRPFSIGDLINSPDRNIEGVVEKIGWRSTRIRNLEQQPLYVPNATFLTVSVENLSRVLFRRLRTDVGVGYDDFQVIPAITQQIETMLRVDPDVAVEQMIWVNLVDFAESLLTIRIYCFTKAKDSVVFQKTKQRIMLKVLDIIQANGAQAASSTQTVDIPNGVILKNQESK